MSEHEHDEIDEHDLGLAHDLPRIMARRGLLGLLGGVGAAVGRRRAGDSGVEMAEGEIPEETAGPYPGDGTNGPNVLAESGVVRSDITTSLGSASASRRAFPPRCG